MRWSFVAITEADIDPLLELERACFAEPWSRLSFTNEFNCRDSLIFGAQGGLDGDRHLLTGYICFRLMLDEMHIFKIAVAPRWQRRGIASWLVDESTGEAVAVTPGTGYTFVMNGLSRSFTWEFSGNLKKNTGKLKKNK